MGVWVCDGFYMRTQICIDEYRLGVLSRIDFNRLDIDWDLKHRLGAAIGHRLGVMGLKTVH